MRTITKSYDLYTYPELSEKAKEKVKHWYLDDPCRNDTFYNDCMEGLRDIFPRSELKIQYSLSYCQGDGFNIYGDLNLVDILKFSQNKSYYGRISGGLRDFLTDKEQKTIAAYIEVCGENVTLPFNSHYSYCISNRIEFAEDWIWELQYQGYRAIQNDTIYKIQKIVIEIFGTLSRLYEESGYDYLYNADEDEIAESCEANDWEFLEDGTFYC